MNFDILKFIVPIAGLLGAAAGVGTFIYNILISGTHRRRESFRFAKEFFEYVAESKNPNPYVLEQGYQAIAGDASLQTREIKYLLTLSDRNRALRDYILGKNYLCLTESSAGQSIQFKDKYKRKISRTWRKYFYFFAYVISFSIALGPVFFYDRIEKNTSDAISLAFFFLAYFGPLAYWALKSGSRIFRSEKLVAYQEVIPSQEKTASYLKIKRRRGNV